jgi:DNA modification methylase
MKHPATNGTPTSHRLYQGDARSFPYIADESVHLVITSPPYWQLRDYHVEGQLGLEPTVDEYIEKLRTKMVPLKAQTREELRQELTTYFFKR